MQEFKREISHIKSRILQYLDFKGVSKYECYQNTGITNGVFSQKSGISEDNILKFLSYYTDVDTDWLLTGVGNMIRHGNLLAEPQPVYSASVIDYKDKYIEQLEKDKVLLQQQVDTLQKVVDDKQAIIDAFLKGDISITAEGKRGAE